MIFSLSSRLSEICWDKLLGLSFICYDCFVAVWLQLMLMWGGADVDISCMFGNLDFAHLSSCFSFLLDWVLHLLPFYGDFRQRCLLPLNYSSDPKPKWLQFLKIEHVDVFRFQPLCFFLHNCKNRSQVLELFLYTFPCAASWKTSFRCTQRPSPPSHTKAIASVLMISNNTVFMLTMLRSKAAASHNSDSDCM